MATVSDISGPPRMDSTASRTVANAGKAATTAPKPTTLPTVNSGKTEELAPASMVSRKAGRRPKLRMTTAKDLAASATATDQTPATAPIVVRHGSVARYEKSRRGSTTSDIRKFVAMTTTRGSTARAKGGSPV